MQDPGSNFLHERHPDFHTSPAVEHTAAYLRANGESIPNQPADKITAYLGFLADENYVNDGILTGDQTSIDGQIEQHVIKAEDVPEAYFELQRRIAREQGQGDVTITPELRRQMIESVQADQRAGLAKWVEYLGGADGGYPDWFKHYTFTALTKLGGYDKDKGEFLKRSKGTTAAYPELNREALAYVYDALNKSRIKGEKVDGGDHDAQLQKLLRSANFGKLYAHGVLAVTPASPELKKEVRGSWTKFNQTSDPRTARRLAGSLQGYGTGWCTAGESTASMQLQLGDFYVYYTRDEDGQDRVPRVAVRMQEGSVAEVRGINPAQELELEMASVASERLQDLPGGETYIRKAEDMKRLTALDKQMATDPMFQLSAADLRFLYEIDHEIEGFGYEKDPRVGEIRAKRGEADYPLLRPLVREQLKEQLVASYGAYAELGSQLNGMRRFRGHFNVLSRTDMERAAAAKFADWEAAGAFDYMTERLVRHGQRFNLVATPNVLAGADEIINLAKTFGQDQPHETYVFNQLYSQYSAEELSGSLQSGAAIRFSLIPNQADPELGMVPTTEQNHLLRQFQATKPDLRLHVPSVLEAVAFWQTLRAKGDKFGAGSFYRTYIRHFNLDPKRVDAWSRVPYSCVRDVGQARLGSSVADRDDGGRVAVG